MTDDQRRGPMSAEEKQFIADNYSKLPAAEIARALRRNEKAIAKYIETNHGSVLAEESTLAETSLKKSPMWKEIQNQFTGDELKLFLYHYGRLYSQFKGDVLPTEEWQIIDAVKVQIMCDRANILQNKNIQEMAATEAKLRIETDMEDEHQDKAEVYNLEKQLGVMRAAQESLGDEYRDLLKEKNNLLKGLKATRDARVKVAESSRVSFNQWMRRIIEDHDLRRDLGRTMEKMRLAADHEIIRLSELHEYMDGQVDQPFLNADTVLTKEDTTPSLPNLQEEDGYA